MIRAATAMRGYESSFSQGQFRLFQHRRSFRFFVGAPNAAWLHRHSQAPLFVSRNQMPKQKFLPAVTDWSLDSGGFTELQMQGRWLIGPEEYLDLLNLYAEKVGRLQWAAQQDWMCEDVVIHGLVKEKSTNGKSVVNFQNWVKWFQSLPPSMQSVVEQTYDQAMQLGEDNANIVFHGTGLSVHEHQRRTVSNFSDLHGKSSVEVIPVIQGFTKQQYHDCVDMFMDSGFDLREFRTVGVGSICRRQATGEAEEIIKSICTRGINIHGFGLKQQGLAKVSEMLVSADSMAWSIGGRRKAGGCISQVTGRPIKNCANCYHEALSWYERTMLLIKE